MNNKLVIFGSPKIDFVDFFTALNAELLLNFAGQIYAKI